MAATHWTWAYLSVCAIVALSVVRAIHKAARLRGTMPPGPPGLPLLGNALQVGASSWLQFTQWKEKYGPIISLNLAGQPVILINNANIAADLLDRRSKTYSSRPRFILAGEVLTRGMFAPLLQANNLWRRMRRAFHDGIGTNILASRSIHSLQESVAAALVSHILHEPARFEQHFLFASASTMLHMVYGWPLSRIETEGAPVIAGTDNLVHRIAQASAPGVQLVEMFPPLSSLPECVAGWKKNGRLAFEKNSAMYVQLMESVKKDIHAGIAEPCLGARLVKDEKYGMSMLEQAWTAGTALIAGTDTTAAAMQVFILAMLLHPSTMQKAQQEIDSVVGRERLPVMADWQQLPYIQAVVREVLRWRPIAPLGAPHVSSRDDWYAGYFIPKGTIMIQNVWAINRDPDYFPDFDTFRPERYLDPACPGNLIDVMPQTHGYGHTSFGAGRRIRPGRELANQSLFLACATLLWAFDIQPAVHENGQPILPSSTECVDKGLFVQPAPFQCKFLPRETEVPGIIQAAARQDG